MNKKMGATQIADNHDCAFEVYFKKTWIQAAGYLYYNKHRRGYYSFKDEEDFIVLMEADFVDYLPVWKFYKSTNLE